jgi:hypothetical protein
MVFEFKDGHNPEKFSKIISEALIQKFGKIILKTKTLLIVPASNKSKANFNNVVIDEELKERFDQEDDKGKYRLKIKDSFKFSKGFQEELCRAFKRGLIKMYLEELNRQKNQGFEEQFDHLKAFARFNVNDIPVFYFTRKHGMLLLFKDEAETPILYFKRMNYLIQNEKFAEIEFLGHVFCFPISNFNALECNEHISKSILYKQDFFSFARLINRITDIDLTLNVLNDT